MCEAYFFSTGTAPFSGENSGQRNRNQPAAGRGSLHIYREGASWQRGSWAMRRSPLGVGGGEHRGGVGFGCGGDLPDGEGTIKSPVAACPLKAPPSRYQSALVK